MTRLHKPPLGALLAGGLSRRMGADKPLQTVGGKTLLERGIARLAPQCAKIILNANGDPARFAQNNILVLPDSVSGFRGPLAGLLTALDWAAANDPGNEWVLSAPIDTPFLPRDLAARLQNALISDNTQIAIASSAEQIHPVVGLWHVNLRHDLREALISDQISKVRSWVARHSSAIVEWPIVPFDPFFNVNTPDDLAVAENYAAIDDLL